jgi:hypothetical protein
MMMMRHLRAQPRRRTAESGDEFAPWKEKGHLALPCDGAPGGPLERPPRTQGQSAGQTTVMFARYL